jgi:Bacterial PH domain
VPDEAGPPLPGEKPDEAGPLSWRVPPVQTALLFLIVCAAAALNIYTHPSSAARGITIVIGLIALAMAIASLRMFLVVDGEGVEVRYLRRVASIPWSQIKDIEIVSGVRGSDTIRFNRIDGSYVDTPPSLLQPSRPTSKPAARHLLKGVLGQLEARRPSS